MTERIDILVSAQNRTGGAFNSIKQDLQGLDNVAATLSRGLSGIGAIAGAGAIVAGLQQIGSELDELARRGAIFEQLGSVLEDFAASVGSSAQAFVEAGRRSAQGTISSYELILNANRAIQFEVAQTAEQYGQLIELATALGRAQGIGDTQALEFITTGIARESRLILDNLGLIIDLDEATNNYAATLGKQGDQLTQAERKQAILAEAYRQGATAIAANRDAADSAATQFERLDANTQNLKDLLGELIAQGSAEYVKLLASELEYASKVLEQREELPDWMTGIAGAMVEAGEGMTSATVQTAVLSQALRIMGAAIEGVDAQGLENKVRSASDAFDQMEGVTSTSTNALIMLRSAADSAAMSARELSFAAMDGADGLSTLESFAWSTASSLDEVARAMGRASAVSSRLSAVRNSAIGQAERLAMQAIQAGGDRDAIIAQYGELVDQIQNAALNMDATNEATLENKLLVQELRPEYTAVWQEIIEADQQSQKLAKSTSGISEEARKAEQAFDDLKSKVSGVLTEALTLDVGVDTESILGRTDAINEDARRLADVAVKGFDSPWYDYFKNEFPALFQEFFAGAADGDGVKKQAAQLLKNFEDGLQPELLDKDKAKERVKRILLGEANMAQLAQEIAAELSAEFGGSISLGKIQATAQAALGVDDGGVQLAQTLTGAASDASGQAAVIGSNIRGGIISALDGIGEAVATTIDKQFRAENNLKVVAAAGQVNGEAWGSGFLVAMDTLTGQVLEKLASLVAPYVEATQARNATLNGAN